jgi:hypothetical protein
MKSLNVFFVFMLCMVFNPGLAWTDQDFRREAMRTELVPSRLTIAMWDFSYLYMHYPGGAFADWNKTLDELLERRFNTVRVDAFPLIIGKLDAANQKVTILADPMRNWGPSDRDVEHDLQQEFVEFMTLTKKKGIQVILSTWNFGCKEFPNVQQDYKTPEQVWSAWEKTLDLLAQKDLLSHVLYVDLDQEFPFFSPFAEKIKGMEIKGCSDTENTAAQLRNMISGQQWNDQQILFVRKLFNESLKHFQRRYPQLRFTFSLTAHWADVRAMRLTTLDVLELHIWMTQSQRFLSRTGFDELVKDRGKHDYSDYMQRLEWTMASVRPLLLEEMTHNMRYAQEWAAEISAPLTTTEAWGPWWHMDHPDLDWQWLYDWCEQCVELAPQYGFWGVTPWNFSHPYWQNWKNVDWYRRVNENFLFQ